jgi:hypothetical protein
LPDFFFGRDKAAEEANGFTLAGKLVTDIPRHKKPSEREIAEIIRILMDKVRRDPDLQEIGLWRSGAKPAGRIVPPFPDAPMIARAERCNVLGVRVDPNAPDGSSGWTTDSLMAAVMGTKLRPERKDDTDRRQDRRRARPHHQRRALRCSSSSASGSLGPMWRNAPRSCGDFERKLAAIYYPDDHLA